VILDDGKDVVADTVPKHPLIRYHRLDRKLTIGAKRNLLCELAQGNFIAHWDDDDWYPSWRLARQMAAMQRTQAMLCGTSDLYFIDRSSRKAFRYACSSEKPWVAGTSLFYKKATWQEHRFLDIQVGEDSNFIWAFSKESVLDLKEPELCVASIHLGNTSRKEPGGVWWKAVDFEQLEQTMASATPPPSPELGDTWENSMQKKETRTDPHSEFCIAQATDLQLTEFAAFNHGQSVPHMRQWELPWATFASQFENTSSVLDCTINPVHLCERIAALYPHVQYRHFNPLANGAFHLPFGFPDEGFDRVLCINTLEHLVQGQREPLLADLARKLKPGGLLVLSSDYYFDSSWTNPAFLNAGVMRADRSEFAGGYNKIAPRDWISSCQKYGLVPVGSQCEIEPREDDPAVFLNLAPFSHATIAGVFSKGERKTPPKKRILLALLTWNTRTISMDSVSALLREARMLTRIGCEPALCVCDNGSTDGTQEALRSIEPQIDIRHSFILNGKNLGNSVARNQIIDCMLKCGADYLLFTDGDIEIVPFSSFAMFRYMENCGHNLGCIGADSASQTPVKERTTPYLFSAENLQKEEIDLVAWTQYGMFRRAVFENGIRFDENVAFYGPGWGFEDNDLAFQMAVKGFRNQRFFGMVYLHRAAQSSIRIMRELGIDPRALYDKRKQYVLDKWSGVPLINSGPLNYIRRVEIRL
jgi:glycosyltransferase involved in cell wall biosynthesis/SAM-dependent methyltransferase